MAHRVFKYPLEADHRQLIQMPEFAKILSVRVQNGTICLWALIDTEESETETRIIRMVSTGEEFDARGCTFIGTFEAEGWFIGHVFEQKDGTPGDKVSDRYAEDFREVGSIEPEYTG